MSQRFPYEHDVDTVYALITDPAFFKERCESMGEKNVSVDVSQAGDKLTMTVSRTVVRELPKVLAKMFSSENTINAVMHWTDHGDGQKKSGNYEAEVQGQPVKLLASYELVPRGDGCEYVIDISCKAKIPLVGKKVEKFVAEQSAEAQPEEARLTREALAARA